jgi:hypothetical protein
MIEGALTLLPAMPSTAPSLLDSEDRLWLWREYVRALLGGARARQVDGH